MCLKLGDQEKVSCAWTWTITHLTAARDEDRMGRADKLDLSICLWWICSSGGDAHWVWARDEEGKQCCK